MMLVTCTCGPPIWLAMLPQKFSAATTWTTRCPPLCDRAPSAVEHAARSVAPAASSTAQADHRDRVMIPSYNENGFHFKMIVPAVQLAGTLPASCAMVHAMPFQRWFAP